MIPFVDLRAQYLDVKAEADAAIHLLPAYADLGFGPGDFPHAELAAAQELSLPLYPEITADAQTRVVEGLHEISSSFDGWRDNRQTVRSAMAS